MLPKKESWRLRRLGVSVLLLVLTWATPAAAVSQDSWLWRLQTERLTQEALAVKARQLGQIYRIQGGDTLWGLARRFDVDLEVLAAMNYLSPRDKLYAGMQIRLPVELDQTYQVRAGDTLWDIAQRYGVEVDRLMAANRIAQPKTLQIGRVLTIPGATVAAAPGRGGSISRGRDGSMNWPLKGRITSPYGSRGQEFHHGLDIGGQIGDPVRAALGGTVRLAGYKNGIYGNAVELTHDNGLVTVYAHLSRSLVKTGERVAASQVIGQVGNTGRTTGPHLHFEVRMEEQAVDPLPYLK